MRPLLHLLLYLLCLTARGGLPTLGDLVVERYTPAPLTGLVDWKVTGPIAHRINIVVASEGYTAAELPSFHLDAQRIWSVLFSVEPWKSHEADCNGFLNVVISARSGTNGAFGSHYGAGGIARLIGLDRNAYFTFWAACSNRFASFADVVPIIVVNCPVYGGSGGAFAVASTHRDSGWIAVHELGHSVAYLDDEYPTGTSIRMPNVATELADLPWQHLIDAGVTGLTGKKIEANRYRPGPPCLMQLLASHAFCPVCRAEIEARLHERIQR